MGLTRTDLEDPKVSDQDKTEIKAWIDRAMANDGWANKIFKDVGVLITSHPANRPYLKACIDSHVKLGYWITLAYDNHIPEHIEEGKTDVDYNRLMPAADVMKDIDTFIMPHHQTWGGVLYPYFWLIRFGAAAMQFHKYIYCTNGDFILEKPENFGQLLELMGDADVMTCGHDDDRYANTAGFIIKSEAFMAVVKHFQDHFIPFSKYEEHTLDIGNAEGRLGRAIVDLRLKRKIIDPPADDMLKVPGKGTWYDLIGFRHIHSEHNHAYRNKGIPPHYKYLDSRFMGDEYNIIRKFWDNGQNKETLKDWWAIE